VDLWGLKDDDKDELDRKMDRVLACGFNGAQLTAAETGTAVQFKDELEKEFARNAACSAGGWGVGKALGAIGRKAGCLWKECKAWNKARKLAKLRNAYEDEIKGLKKLADELAKSGKNAEDRARTLFDERNKLKDNYLKQTPADEVESIKARNLERYGNENGPSIDWLRQQGKTWEDIINSASRPGGKDLGL
jgi:hypothetical protein